MSSPTQGHSPTRDEILRAAEERAHEHPHPMDIRQLQRIHDLKQNFRRLIVPGIMRPNSREAAILALKTLETLSDNLLREPENEKFRSFKPTNTVIKKRLVEVKGALEYAVALGFHHKVENFQPLYVFNDRHFEDLQIGNEIIKEAINREAEITEKASHSSILSVKQQKELERRKIQLQIHEDRLARKEKDRREAALRGAAAQKSDAKAPPSPEFPQGGITLSGRVEPAPSAVGSSRLTRRVSYEGGEDE